MIRTALWAILAGVPIFAATCDAQCAPPLDRLPTTENAALVYWQAIAVLPDWTKGEWTADQRRLVDDSPFVEFDPDESSEAVFAASEPVTRLMRHAASLPSCDWGTNLNDGPAALFPHASRVRQLVRLAAFRVLFQCRSGALEGAVDDGLAIVSLARHMCRDRLLISTFTGYANEAQAVTALAEVVSQLDRSQLQKLAQRHAALPARPRMGECILSEKRAFLGWLARHAREAGADAALDTVALIAGNGGFFATGALLDSKEEPAELPWLEALRAEANEDAELLPRLIVQTGSLWDEAAKVVEAPADELPKKSAAWLDKLKDAHPLSKALLPRLSAAHAATIRVNARQAILQAGIACRLEGDAGLQAHPEPFTGKPFTLRRLADGFELRSDLDGGEPLIVKFGRSVDAR
jgi:hypothetical protein